MVVTVQRACLFVICNRRCLFIWILKAAAIVPRQGVVRLRVSIFEFTDRPCRLYRWKCEYTDNRRSKMFNLYSFLYSLQIMKKNEKHRFKRNKRSNLYILSTMASFVFECGSWLNWFALSCFVMIQRLFLLQERPFFQVVPFHLLAVSSIAPFRSQILTAVNPIISKILDIDILQIIFYISFVQWTLYCNLFNLD